MYQPHTITFNCRWLLIERDDGADYHGPVPWRIRLNPLRYSLTIRPGRPGNKTFNERGWLARKVSNAIYILRHGRP